MPCEDVITLPMAYNRAFFEYNLVNIVGYYFPMEIFWYPATAAYYASLCHQWDPICWWLLRFFEWSLSLSV
jgi:hypothetical protein